MFHTSYLSDHQSYLIVDYNPFSLSVGILTFQGQKPHLSHCVQSFFWPDERDFHPRTFERNFLQSCEDLKEKMWADLPQDVCVFLDHQEYIALSSGYTFFRKNPGEVITWTEIHKYAQSLYAQSDHQAEVLWWRDYGYNPHDRRLLSVFLTNITLDKKYHLFPIGKIATHISLRCLFFYSNRFLIDQIKNTLHRSWYKLLTCAPLPIVFLNHICNQLTFHENHLHIHFGYDTTSVILHLGKKIQEIQSVPIGWKQLYDALAEKLSPLERENLLTQDSEKLFEYDEYSEYQKLSSDILQVIFERFHLQWTFSHVSVSTQGPMQFFVNQVRSGSLSPWIQPNAKIDILESHPKEKWLKYFSSLDSFFQITPHPLLSLIRSVFIDENEHI